MATAPEEFRDFALECLRWAGETKSERRRQVLLEMARTWIQAAVEFERSEGPMPLRTAKSRPGK